MAIGGWGRHFDNALTSKLGRDTIRPSVVKLHHFTISLQQLIRAYLHCHSTCLTSTHIFCRIVLSFFTKRVPYPGYSVVEEVYRSMIGGENEGEDAILYMLWRKNEGGIGKNFSRQDACLHYLTAAVRPEYLHCDCNWLISIHIFWRIVLSFCKMTAFH
jgi:hypothetical protein